MKGKRKFIEQLLPRLTILLTDFKESEKSRRIILEEFDKAIDASDDLPNAQELVRNLKQDFLDSFAEFIGEKEGAK